jgi:glucokinase
MSFLAIDFGGTRTRAGLFSAGLKLLARTERLSQVHRPVDDVLRCIIETARHAAANAPDPIEAIGIAAPGPLDPHTGVIHHARTLPGWQEVNVAAHISEAFGGAPAFVQNDGNLAVLAEYHLGAARGADPAIYLTLSTGIGGGAIIGGELFTGHSGLAIEPGHQQFTMPDGEVRRLEELASGTGITHLAERRLACSDAPSSLRSAAGIDGRAVGEAARQGDALALSVIHEAGRWLGLGLVNIIHLFNPEAIVLGGSVVQLGNLILDPVRRTIEERVLDPDFNHSGLLRHAQFGDDVCLVGAALYARLRAESASQTV